jgi:hypothetical protein
MACSVPQESGGDGLPAATIVDQLCTFFGGAYDPGTHSYRSPQLSVPGLAMGALRRARPKHLDNSDYYLGAVGAQIGCLTYVFLTPGDETREGFGGATAGLKKVRHHASMEFLLRSESDYAEDIQDAMYALQAAVTGRIHTDRTCGSGGIEAGGFQVGEGPLPGIHWTFSDAYTVAEKTQALVKVEFSADEYIIA